MKEKFRAIKIDAHRRLITELFIDEGIDEIQKQIGCSLFTIAGNFNRVGNLADSLYVDDEGLFKSANPVFSFKPPQWIMQVKFAGNGLILGCDFDTGATVSARVSLFDAAMYVDWTRLTSKNIAY